MYIVIVLSQKEVVMRDLKVKSVKEHEEGVEVNFHDCMVTFIMSYKWLRSKKIITLKVGQRVIIEGNHPTSDEDVCLAMPSPIKDIILIG